MIERFTENDIAMFGYTFLELLLKISATMLIFTKLRDLPLKVLNARASKTVD